MARRLVRRRAVEWVRAVSADTTLAFLWYGTAHAA